MRELLPVNHTGHIQVRSANSIRPSDLKSPDNFIFVGNPRSNPWTSLYNERLDFQFAFDATSQKEFIHNVRTRANEKADYIPSPQALSCRLTSMAIR